VNPRKLQNKDKTMRTFLKSLLVGAVYAFALLISGMIIRVVGLSLPEVKDALTRMIWSYVGGVIAGLCLGSLAGSMPASRGRHLFVWVTAIFLNIASVAIEGYFFAPELIGNSLPALLVQQLIAALATGWVITALFASKESAAPVPSVKRPLLSWTWRFLACVLVYAVFYFIFGSINYILVTKPYYETHAGGLDVPPVQVTLAAEVVRGALIALSVLPFLHAFRANKKRTALVTGFLLFAIGGLVPLTMQVGALPFFLLVASAWEIFAMNFSAGIALAKLLGQPE
jgi:hypothetical protein